MYKLRILGGDKVVEFRIWFNGEFYETDLPEKLKEIKDE